MNLFRVLLHFIWPESFEEHKQEQEITPETQNLEDEYISMMFESEPFMKNVDGLTVYSACVYHSAIKRIIYGFKYEDRKNLCLPLGRAMGKFFTPPKVDYIIPVPLHMDSKRKYNQSYELAKSISEIWNIKAIEAAKWTRAMPRRATLKASERIQLTPDDFTITRDIRGRRAAIIDDVCTTGTTLSCFARALEQSGVWVVCAYTLAASEE